jgi:site-specific recombinase XerD
LDDIDWRHGEITVRGKGNRAERLPLPVDVGAVVAGYLRRGQPTTAQGRSVFVRVKAPHRGLTSAAVSNVVSDCAHRAGLGPIRAHRLRHTAATAMLRAGSPLAEVGQVLRHRSTLTTRASLTSLAGHTGTTLRLCLTTPDNDGCGSVRHHPLPGDHRRCTVIAEGDARNPHRWL